MITQAVEEVCKDNLVHFIHLVPENEVVVYFYCVIRCVSTCCRVAVEFDEAEVNN